MSKERTFANTQAAYSTKRATAQAAHDAALLSAIDNWQTSNRASTLALLLAQGQSREAYNKATASVFANWETGIGNLLIEKPKGTAWADRTSEKKPSDDRDSVSGIGSFFSFDWFGNEEDKEDTSDLPEDPSVAEIANDKIVQYRDAIKSLPSFSCSLNPIEQWVHTGIRNWGVDLFAGVVAVGLHGTIKQVDPTANADTAFLLAWAGESNIPSLMTANDPILSQTAESLQSLARDKAIELNRGHAGLGVSGTPVLDEVAFEVPTSLLSAGLPKMLGMGARVSKKISEEGIKLVLDAARRVDDEAIEAAAKARQILDDADDVPLEKVLEDAPNSIRYLDPKSVADFSLAERLDFRTKHQSLIQLLERGQDVSMPSGAASSKLLGEITAATGREVGLIRVDGRRVLRMGTIDGIEMSDASRIIAHTHPSGDLRFSGVLGGSDGDIPLFRLYQPRQRSSGLIAPDGTFVRILIPWE